MFADLAGYTALTDVHGDDEAVAAVETFHAVVSRAAEAHDLQVIKGIGDAFLLVGEGSGEAIKAGREIVEAMGAIERTPAVRVGIHSGPISVRGGDVFGQTVNIAARVASEAHPGQVLFTQEMLGSGPVPPGVEPVSVGTRALRNVAAPVELLDVSDDRSLGKFIDPVCRMLVSAQGATATLRHHGAIVYFCSRDCLERFIQTQGIQDQP